LFAGILLEGGITSYETNVYTGGAGVRYFGTDASAQYREDRVSIYLRAVSTSNGKILKTVYTTKSILSQEVSMGVFRYVKYKRLLEAETGYTYNEPTELAVTEAIEKAVQSLIVEGVMDKLWELKNEEDSASDAIQEYIQEKENRVQVDHVGRPFESHLRGNVYTSLMGSGQFYSGDYSVSYLRPGSSIGLGYRFFKNFALETNAGFQNIYIKNLVGSREYFGEMNLLFLANPRGHFSPYLSIGGGGYFADEVGLSEKKVIPYIGYGAGVEYMVSPKLALTGKAFVNQMFSDYYDGVKMGDYNDRIWGINLGIRIYMGKP
jgi:curli production assembly/transport component CsgG